MFKKAYLVCSILCAFMSITILSEPLANLQFAVKAVLRAYEMHIKALKLIEKNNSQLALMIPVIEASVAAASQDFKSKIDAAAKEQYDAIVDQNVAFSPKQYEAVLTDIDPSVSSTDVPRQKIFEIIVQRDYLKLLWQKLSDKVQELTEQAV